MRSNSFGGDKLRSLLLDSNGQVVRGDDFGSGCVGRGDGNGGFFGVWHRESRGLGNGPGGFDRAREEEYAEGDGPWEADY